MQKSKSDVSRLCIQRRLQDSRFLWDASDMVVEVENKENSERGDSYVVCGANSLGPLAAPKNMISCS